MAYNRTGYFKRAKAIQELTARHYEPGRQDRCLKWVWRYHILPVYGIGYRAYLNCLNVLGPDVDGNPTNQAELPSDIPDYLKAEPTEG